MATTNPNYNVNYDDERFTQVTAEKNEALSDLEQTYAGMINDSDSYYQAQIDASKDWAAEQSRLQQEQTDFAIEQIEQEKAQAQKDYTKEQSGSYVDWQKQSNAYGANAEQMAANGLTNTGYSETAQVSMYNAYQARVTAARESFNLAVLNYNNAIKDARLQNNSVLAEIAATALQQQLELSLQGFQYKNQLILEKANKKLEVEESYYQRYQDVLAQINQENALAEEVRQFNANYDLQVKEYEESIRQFDEEIARLKANDAKEYQLEIQKLELEKQQLAQEQSQWEAEMAYKKQQLAASSSSSGGSSSGGGSKTISASSSSSKTLNSNGSGSTKKTTSGNSVTVDQASVMALGMGPMSASKLASYVKSGKVIMKQKDGKLTYEWNPVYAVATFK